MREDLAAPLVDAALNELADSAKLSTMANVMQLKANVMRSRALDKIRTVVAGSDVASLYDILGCLIPEGNVRLTIEVSSLSKFLNCYLNCSGRVNRLGGRLGALIACLWHPAGQVDVLLCRLPIGSRFLVVNFILFQTKEEFLARKAEAKRKAAEMEPVDSDDDDAGSQASGRSGASGRFISVASGKRRETRAADGPSTSTIPTGSVPMETQVTEDESDDENTYISAEELFLAGTDSDHVLDVFPRYLERSGRAWQAMFDRLSLGPP